MKFEKSFTAAEYVTKSTHTAEYGILLAILAAARREAGLTQQQVADKLGRPQSYVAKLERGERRLDIVEFAKLASAMGLDPAVMFQKLLNEFDQL